MRQYYISFSRRVDLVDVICQRFVRANNINKVYTPRKRNIILTHLNSVEKMGNTKRINGARKFNLVGLEIQTRIKAKTRLLEVMTINVIERGALFFRAFSIEETEHSAVTWERAEIVTKQRFRHITFTEIQRKT